MPDALQLLRNDHREVQELFKQFEQTEDRKQKQQIAEKAIMELDIHAEIEEEIFYPSVRKQPDVEGELMDEAEEEHHVVHLLIAELKAARVKNEKWEAKFKVLAENVRHHIQEEESEMLPRAAEAGQEYLASLGEKMERRKMQLKQTMMRGGRTASRGRTAGSGRSRTTARTGSRNGTARRTTRGATGGTTTRRRSTRPATTRRSPARSSTAARASRAGSMTRRRTATRATATSSRGRARASTGTRSRSRAR